MKHTQQTLHAALKADTFYTEGMLPTVSVPHGITLRDTKLGNQCELSAGAQCLLANTRLGGSVALGNNVSVLGSIAVNNSTLADDVWVEGGTWIECSRLGRGVNVGGKATVYHSTVSAKVRIPAGAFIAFASEVTNVAIVTNVWQTNDHNVLTAYQCAEGVLFYIKGLPGHQRKKSAYTLTELTAIAIKHHSNPQPLIAAAELLANAVQVPSERITNAWGKGRK